jgi:hypothetical protein
VKFEILEEEKLIKNLTGTLVKKCLMINTIKQSK